MYFTIPKVKKYKKAKYKKIKSQKIYYALFLRWKRAISTQIFLHE